MKELTNIQTQTAHLVATQQPETIVNPVTGDRMTVLHSNPTGEGEYFKVRFDLPPGAKGSPLHYHTKMGETFTVLQGCLEMEVGGRGKRLTLQAGESVYVPPGMQHSFRNASEQWVTYTSENTPAGQFEQFIRGLFGLAIDGKTNREGMPTNPLHLALLLRKADTVLVGPSHLVQKLLIDTLIQVAGWLGSEQAIARYWNKSSDR
ncbi:cupin domain-containing protein [Scytonema sp. UIC 10036]|uniref:cupin domain-containing protein n=1 Tax=Scytonema sp. UIC 10036 TaxID=2304196 RepID=UPI0012DA5DDD|nr:cupin domain-containing protein [Scytonema sp. UIC 10036]MUG92035.1 cupin domain-containing protein [Scytonema sp. UIC 10036]